MPKSKIASILILAPAFLFFSNLPAQAHQYAHSHKHLKELGAPDAARALATAETRLKKNPADLKALWIKAEALQFTGKYIDSEQTFKALLESAVKQHVSKKDLAAIYAEWGLAQGSSGHVEEALTSYNKAIELNPQASEIHLVKAWKLWQTSKKEALAELDAYIAQAKDEDSYVNKAHFLYEFKRTEDAFKALKEAERKFPDSPFVNFERAYIYAMKGDPESAEKYADKAQKKLSFAGYIYADIATLYKRQFKIDKAINALRKVCLYWPRPESFSVLAKNLQDKGKIDEAAKVLDKAHAAYPKVEEFVDRKCKMYRVAGRWKDSLATAQYKIDHFPVSTQGYLNRALCYEALGEYKKAVADFDRAIGDKTYKREIVNRAKCNLAIKHYQKVINDANLCLSVYPGHITAMQLRTCAKMGLGKLQDALADADLLLKNSNENGDVIKLRADILQKLGRTKEAGAEFARAAKFHAVNELPEDNQ
ncbi:MAG: tetratricopeptide repeat protein [Candidatus Melainabacteria bacterium]|nr:tetratricopeptide repeat protein [Candidatus Melainabacteria bacterium]